MLRIISHLFLGIASQIGAVQHPGQLVIVLDASQRMVQTGAADTAIYDTVADAVVTTLAERPVGQKGLRASLRLAGGEPADEDVIPCEATTLVLPPSEVISERWRQALDDHRPHGACPLIRAIVAGLNDGEEASPLSRLVVITNGGDDCGGTREEVVQALTDGCHGVDLRVVGILLRPEAVAFFDSVPLRNVENPDDLESALRWAFFEGNDSPGPKTPEPPAAALESPAGILVGEAVEVRWTGPNAAEDFISLARPDTPGDAYIVWARTESGNPAVLTAPAQPGAYEIRYVSGTDAEVLARSPVEIAAADIDLQAPSTVLPEQRFSVLWTGSAIPGDFVALSRPKAPPQRMLDWASTAAGSSVTLTAPDRPGSYEVRFIRKTGLEILARLPVEVAR